MKLKRLFRAGSSGRTGIGFAWNAIFVLVLGACGNGDNAVSGMPDAPVVPVVPVAANSVFVASPAAEEILAYAGQAKVVTLVFRASEGSATGLALTLPAATGWRAADGALNCASVDTAGTCKLQAVYTPAAPAASSNLRFSYSYTDSSGAAREDAYFIAYRVLPVSTVVTSQQPEGMLRGIVGQTAPVTVSFDTSDGEPAASLNVSTDLAALPAGWKSDSVAFSCAAVGRGQACRLTLDYSPLVPARESMLDLAYRYVDNSGASRSGSARLNYSATLAGSVNASLDPGGLVLVKPGERKEITVRFAASDGARASALRLSADPTATPGWSVAPGWQGCAIVEGSDSCSLTLAFAPAGVFGPRTLSLPYAYVDNTGGARSGSVDIAYSSRIYEAYIADYREDAPGGVRLCTIDADGGLANCAAATIVLPGRGRMISHVIAQGRQAYVSSLEAGDSSSVSLCAIAADGALKDCRATGEVKTGVRRLLLRGASVYIVAGDGKVLRQDLDVATGEIRACPAARGNCEMAGLGGPIAAMGFVGADAYIARAETAPNSDYINGVQCRISAAEGLDCSVPPFLPHYFFAAGAAATLQDGTTSRIYIAGDPYYPLLSGEFAVIKCDVSANGVIGGCETGGIALIDYSAGWPGNLFRDMTFDGKHAYLVRDAAILRCDISAVDGKLPNCNAQRGTGATHHFSLSINRIN